MAGDYTIEDTTGDHSLQIGEFNPADGDMTSRPTGLANANTLWGYCAYCKWSVGAQSSTRSVRRAYERHLRAAAKKGATDER